MFLQSDPVEAETSGDEREQLPLSAHIEKTPGEPVMPH